MAQTRWRGEEGEGAGMTNLEEVEVEEEEKKGEEEGGEDREG